MRKVNVADNVGRGISATLTGNPHRAGGEALAAPALAATLEPAARHGTRA